MPIRLLVAVTVGIAAFGLLVPMADSVEQAERTELTVESEPRQLTVESGERSTARVDIVTTDGQPVEGATLLVSGRSLAVDGGPVVFETDESSTVAFDIGTDPSADVPVSFRSEQTHGTIRLRVVAPPNSEYVDDLSNPELTIRRAD